MTSDERAMVAWRLQPGIGSEALHEVAAALIATGRWT